MKNFKILSSIAAVAAISCVAAASSMAADAIELQLDTAASTNSSKVINVYYKGDTLGNVKSISYIDIVFDGATEDDITLESDFDTITYEMYDGAYSISTESAGLVEFDGEGFLLATLTVDNADALKMTLNDAKIAGGQAVNINKNKTISPDISNFAVINAEDLGVFADGEGDAVRAYKAAAAVDGTITWNVTNGEKVATATSSVNGGADVIVGLRVAGAKEKLEKLTYAAVTID